LDSGIAKQDASNMPINSALVLYAKAHPNFGSQSASSIGLERLKALVKRRQSIQQG